MKRWSCVALFLTAGWLSAADPAQDELKKLEGTWEFKSSDLAGKPVPAEFLRDGKLVIKGDKYTLSTLGEVTDEGTIKIDPTKKPRTIDRVSTKIKDFTTYGIYELDGDKLRICENGQKRPTEFDSSKGMLTSLNTFQRKK
jgi:uncharacterized protein (TIGR03067 family)